MEGLLPAIRHNGINYSTVLTDLATKHHNSALIDIIALVKEKVNRERGAVFIQAAFRGFCGRKVAAFKMQEYKRKRQPMTINEWRNDNSPYQTHVAVCAVEEACTPNADGRRMPPEVGTAYVGYWDHSFRTLSGSIMDKLGFQDSRIRARAELMVLEKLVEMNNEFQAMVQKEDEMESRDSDKFWCTPYPFVGETDKDDY